MGFADNTLENAMIGAVDMKRLGAAGLIIMVFDYCLTAGQEYKLFWSWSNWSISRVLFFLNRYLLLFIVGFSQVAYHTPHRLLSDNFCLGIIKTIFMLNFTAIIVVQVIISMRVWHLFNSSLKIHSILLISFFFSITLSAYFASHAIRDLKIFEPPIKESFDGCAVLRPPSFWRFHLPSLGSHTMLYALTLWRAVQSRGGFRDKPVLHTVITEGGLFYLAVLISTVLTTIGAYYEDMPRLNLPAIFSNFTAVITTLSVSRIMLSIESLAADFSSSPKWLLNNVELSRVQWRMGTRPNEIIVEVEGRDEDEELERAQTQNLDQHVVVDAENMTLNHMEMVDFEYQYPRSTKVNQS